MEIGGREYHLLAQDNDTQQNEGASDRLSKTLPPEVMHLIISHIFYDNHMPVESITNLALVDKAMWGAYAAPGGRIPSFKALCAIRAAMQSHCNIDKTRAALLAIDKAPPGSKPQLMRTFAENALGLAKISPGHDLAEWGQMVTRIETWLADTGAPDRHGQQLIDLRIANVHAMCLPFLERTDSELLGHQLQSYMQPLPSTTWGDFIETADALDLFVSHDDWLWLLTNGTALSRSPSDKFARAVGLRLAQFLTITDPIRCLENIGITKAQIDRIVIPSCAIPLLYDIADRKITITAECERWGVYAERLAAAVEDCFFLAHIDEMRNNTWPMWRLEIDIGLNPERLHENRIAFVRKMECDTIQALGNDQTQIDAFITNWMWASTPVHTVDEWIKKFEHLTSETIPLVCQPALIDRWALAKKIDREAEIGTRFDSVYALLKSAMTLPDLRSQPTLLCRMAVALIHAMDACPSLASDETITARDQLITAVFEELPPFAWGWMLELGLLEAGRIDRHKQHARFNAFILDPLSSTSLPTGTFSVYVIGAASEVWEAVPDQADGDRSKLDVFCDRFGIAEHARTQAKKTILMGIVARAKSGKFTLAEGLALGGFDADPAARQHTNKAYQYRTAS